MDFGGRRIVFKALVGSHNYNLNNETSDKDYKYFILPTFDDLYSGKMFSSSRVGVEFDYNCHDIRQLSNLFWKANINFLEVLYSKEIEHYWYEFAGFGILKEIFSMRDKIVTMNLPYLYNACKGMYFEKMKRLEKGTEGTQHLVEEYSYDTKQALHAIRVLDFCVKFQISHWNFKYAMEYYGMTRDEFLEIKHGKYTLEEFKQFAEWKLEYFLGFEPFFKNHQPDLETKVKLEELIKELVRKNI